MPRSPEEPFETGRWFTPQVDRFGQVTVRTNRYSVPARTLVGTIQGSRIIAIANYPSFHYILKA
jgi:hypothetical protein